jgi:hypothetical protein
MLVARHARLLRRKNVHDLCGCNDTGLLGEISRSAFALVVIV